MKSYRQRPFSLPPLFLLLPTVLIIVAIYGELERASRAADACLSLVGKSVRTPGFWSLFGLQADKDDDTAEHDTKTTEQSTWTTTDWIERHKYDLEEHNVNTIDGYRLLLHRLPQPGHRPILLVHGLMTSSLGWVFMGPGRSLAFLLRDKQHDVWLANLRGSMYGRENQHFNTSTEEFWSYSFHEQGLYDMAAIIEHIRNETSFHQVSLITHSQAFNSFLALCSLKPEYNERIVFLQALAPPLELRNLTKLTPKDMKKIQKFLRAKTKAQAYELFPKGYLTEKCINSNADERKQCQTIMRMITGRQQYSKTMEPLIYGQLLQGGSIREAKHLTQLWLSGDFAAFDYGVDGNIEHYNSVSPLVYDLSQITVPVILHFGDTDSIATPNGVHRVYSHILQTILGVYRVTADAFNHLDFLCATEVKSLVNEKVIALMDKYFDGQLTYVIE